MVRRRYVILFIVTELLLITLVIISSSLIHNYVVTVVGVGVLLTLSFLYMALMKGVRGVRLNLTYVA
ncbi:MAG: hypothetical protein QXH99_07150, partial [Sulfolobales archaeon]